MPGWNTSKWQRPKQWSTLRKTVLERDSHRCAHCGAKATHVDHITHQAAGGGDTIDNLQALCVSCHRTKSSGEGGNGRATKMRHPNEQHPGAVR